MNQKRYAYLFGANGPAGMQLQYAEKDVQRLASALQEPRYGFTTNAISANSRDDVLEGLEEYTTRCTASDLLLVHFSGHAIYKGQLYLLCNKSKVNSLRRSAIDIRDIKGYLHECKAKQKILILDCCHAGAAHTGGPYKEKGDDGDDIRIALQDAAQGSASLIFSACSHRHTTRELATLDSGFGFLSWLLHAACTDRFQEVSSDKTSLSLDDIDRWIPTALAEVNATLSVEHHLPLPIFFGEWEGGSGRNIWFTNPPATVSPKRSNPDANRAKYLQHVYERYNTVTLPIGPTQGFSLHAIFQPLALRSDPLMPTNERKKRRLLLGESSPDDEAIRFSDARDQYEKKRSNEHDQPPPSKKLAEHGEDALKQSPHGRIIILGGPGTGKTTTLKYLVGRRAKIALADSTAPLPLYLSLVDLARSGKTLQSYLVDLVEKMGIEKSYADMLWREIEYGHAFVALDSLDEIDPKERPDIVDLINHYASEKGNTWLVGSRFSEYKGGQFTQGKFFEWELLPMTPSLRRSLADRLFPELYRLFALSSNDPLSPTTFVHLLENHPQASAWGENPLLLSLAAVIYAKTGGLPSSRAALYRDVIAAVLSTREPSELKRIHLLQELMDLALWLYQLRRRIFTSHDLLNFLKREQRHSFQEVEHIAQRMISSGILDLVAQDTYGFRHQTFLEYLAGFALAMRLTDHHLNVRDEAWKLAWSKRTYSRWTEVLCLMVGVLVQLPGKKGSIEAQRWLKALVAQRITAHDDPGDLGLALALKSLSEATNAESWKTHSTLQLEQQVLDLWLDTLFMAAQTGRTARKNHLVALTESSISFMDDNFVLRRLVKSLRDRDAYARYETSNILQKAGKKVTSALLVRLLQDDSAVVRVAAVQALGERRERISIDTLMEMLTDRTSSVRAAAIDALEMQGNTLKIDALIEMLSDSEFNVCSAAREALSRQGNRVPIEVLMKMLASSEQFVRDTAVKILEKQGERVPVEVLTGMLTHSNTYVRAAVVQVLSGQGERVPVEVLTGMLMTDRDIYVRAAAAQALGKQGERVPVEVLTGMLTDNNGEVRKAAAQALGRQGEHVPVEVLTGMLTDNNDEVRKAAAQALSRQDRTPVEVLMKMLIDRDNSVRAVAVEALKNQGEHVSVEILVDALSNRASSVRAAIVEMLGRRQKEQVPFEVLIGALTDSSEDVRVAAVEALKSQEEHVSVEILVDALVSNAGNVRVAALEVLREKKERIPIEILLEILKDGSYYVRLEALMALKEQGDLAPIEVLIEALADPNSEVRVLAVQTLEEQGDLAPIEVLIEALADPNSEVRGVAVQALGRQGERVPVDLLLGMLTDSIGNVIVVAFDVLERQGERVPIEVLLGTLANGLGGKSLLEMLEGQEERGPVEMALILTSHQPPFFFWLVVETLKKYEGILSAEALVDSHWSVRAAALEVFRGQRKQINIEVLIEALDDSNSIVKIAAMQALSEQGEHVPIAVLEGMLADSNDEEKAAAVQALSEQGEHVPIAVLEGMLADNNAYLGALALQVLRVQGEDVPADIPADVLARMLVNMLTDSNDEVVKEAIFFLEVQGERVPIDRLLRALANFSSIREIAWEVVEMLRGRVPVEALLEMLTHGNTYNRAIAVQVLGVQGEHVPLDMLLGALADSDASVRAAAIKVLLQREPAALEPVMAEAITILQKQPAGLIFGSLIQDSFLNVIKSTGYSAPLVLVRVTELLDWPYWQVRMKAAETLGVLRRNIPDTAIRRLLALRRDPDPLMKSVREASDDALAEILSLEDGIEDD